MKKIISFFIISILIFSMVSVSAFAGVANYYDVDLKVEFDSETFELNRSVKFTINYPQNNGGYDVEINDSLYEDVYITVMKIYDTNGILDFSYFFDETLHKYEGHFIPVKSGETQITAEFEVRGLLNGEDVQVPGADWLFSITSDALTVEDIEVESGYFENSSEETFDTSSYYAQLYQSQMTASQQANPNDSSKETGKSPILTVMLIFMLVLLVLVVAFLLYRNYNIKKYKKRR